MMSLKEWSLAHKINDPTSELITFTIPLQVPIRRVPVISTVSSATITAPTPTKLWLTEDNIRSWTASWLLGLRSSPPPNTVPSTAAATPGSRRITTAGNVSTQCWACLRWRPTSTDTWTSSWSWSWSWETVNCVSAKPAVGRPLSAQHQSECPDPANRPGCDVGNWGVWQSQLASRNSI